ncbi:MAG: serine/threonine-protein kinase [Polyangiales bacterium]
MTLAGEVLAARWALDEKIDAGAMGEIFRGRHRVLGHTVAVKVMIPDAAREGASTERFLREARIAARLRHPHVVRVEDFGVSDDGRSFLVMELLHGESLARRLARAPRLTPPEVLSFVRQLCSALDAAHAEGIVHRDLKPENIFLCDTPDGAPHVKVLDFGVAKFADTLSEGGHATASNALIGTPKYMSPEQARSSRDLDGRSDLWAVGMLVYEMLSGQHPFEGEAIAELLVAILTQSIPPPSSVAPSLPPSLDVWMSRALARSRDDRFATGQSLSDALAEALDGRVGDSWGEGWSPRETPRRATLRVRRPAGELAPSPQPPDSVPPPDVAAPPALPDPRKESMELRSSWRSGLLAGLLAASAIFGLSQLRGPARPREARPTPALSPPPEAAAALAEPAPAPPPTAEPAPAVSASLTPPEALDAATTEAVPLEPRHRRAHRRRHHRARADAQVGNPSDPGGGMYDPSGI